MVDLVKVYTLPEIAEILRVSELEAGELIGSGELSAFVVRGQPRITSSALADLMARPYKSESRLEPAEMAAKVNRGRDKEAVAAIRERIARKVLQVQPQARFRGPTMFEEGSRVGFIRTATKRSGPANDYWVGFRASRGDDPREVFLIFGLPNHDLVLPYGELREVLDGLSESHMGQKEFHLDEFHGELVMKGKSLAAPLSVTRYLDRFEVFS